MAVFTCLVYSTVCITSSIPRLPCMAARHLLHVITCIPKKGCITVKHIHDIGARRPANASTPVIHQLMSATARPVLCRVNPDRYGALRCTALGMTRPDAERTNSITVTPPEYRAGRAGTICLARSRADPPDTAVPTGSAWSRTAACWASGTTGSSGSGRPRRC